MLTYVDLGYPYVPIWVSFCGGLGGLIGANFDLNLAVLLAAYNDALSSSTQVATYFFITTSMQYVGQVAFPLLAGKAINLDGKGGTSEVSLFISLGMAFAGLLISVLFFPETMKKAERIDSAATDETNGGSKRKGIKATIAAKGKSLREGFQQSVQGVGATNVILLIIAMFLATTAIKAVDWLGLIQYPVIKFGWKYNQVCGAVYRQRYIHSKLTVIFSRPSQWRYKLWSTSSPTSSCSRPTTRLAHDTAFLPPRLHC